MIPSSRPKLSDLYTLSQSELLEDQLPFTAAHTYIAHIWQYPPSPEPGPLVTVLWREQHTYIKLIYSQIYRVAG